MRVSARVLDRRELGQGTYSMALAEEIKPVDFGRMRYHECAKCGAGTVGFTRATVLSAAWTAQPVAKCDECRSNMFRKVRRLTEEELDHWIAAFELALANKDEEMATTWKDGAVAVGVIGLGLVLLLWALFG